MECILEYIYKGVISISECQVSSFKKISEKLKLKDFISQKSISEKSEYSEKKLTTDSRYECSKEGLIKSTISKYVCKCGFEYKYHASFLKHKEACDNWEINQSANINVEEKNISCKCGKLFTNKGNLNKHWNHSCHKNLNRRLKTHICKCGSKNTYKHDLIKHQKLYCKINFQEKSEGQHEL